MGTGPPPPEGVHVTHPLARLAQWYSAAVLPAVRRGGLVHIHDVQTDPLAPRPDLPLPATSEELEVRRFLATRASD